MWANWRHSSIQEGTSIAPSFVFFLLRFSSSHFPCWFGWTAYSRHIWCLWLELLCLRQIILVAVLLWLTISSSSLSISIGTHHHLTCFLFSVECHQFFTILLIWHSKLFLNRHDSPEAVDVITVVRLNIQIDLESFVEQVHPTVA